MSQPIGNSNDSCSYFRPVIEPVVGWIRSGEKAPLEEKVAIYVITFLLLLVLAGSILGIPLIYLGLKE
jgi:hypothetical protein